MTLQLQHVVTGSGRLQGPEGGHFGEGGREVSWGGDGWEGVNGSLEGVLVSWRGLLGSSSKTNRVCVLVN